MGLVHVILHGVFNLRRQIARIARIPERFAGRHHRRRQAVKQHDGIRTFVERVLAADRLDLALLAAADRHADAVAFDQPASLVGDRIGRLARVQAGVRRTREILELVPQRLPVGEVPQLARLEKVARQIAHLKQELQVAALRGGRRTRTLENLDDAASLLVHLDGAENQQEIAGIGRLAVLPVARVRLHQSAFAAGQHLLEQLTMAGHILLVVRQAGFTQVALVLKFQAPPLVEDPDGAANGRQGRYHPVEECSMELAGADVLLGKLGNFDDQAANLLLGLLDQVGIDRLFCAHANTSLGQAGRRELRRGGDAGYYIVTMLVSFRCYSA